MAISVPPPKSLSLSTLRSTSSSSPSIAAFPVRWPCLLLHNHRLPPSRWFHPTVGRGYLVLAASSRVPLKSNSVPQHLSNSQVETMIYRGPSIAGAQKKPHARRHCYGS